MHICTGVGDCSGGEGNMDIPDLYVTASRLSLIISMDEIIRPYSYNNTRQFDSCCSG